jgi:hypothetical protein
VHLVALQVEGDGLDDGVKVGAGGVLREVHALPSSGTLDKGPSASLHCEFSHRLGHHGSSLRAGTWRRLYAAIPTMRF